MKNILYIMAFMPLTIFEKCGKVDATLSHGTETYNTRTADSSTLQYMGYARDYTSSQGVPYQKHATHSRIVLTTDAPSIDIEGLNDSEGSGYADKVIAQILVNGAFFKNVVVQNWQVKEWVTVVLPSGTKTVTINQPQYVYFAKAGGTPWNGGGSFSRVRYSSLYTTTIQAVSAKTNKFIFYGDSITGGSQSDPVSQYAYVVQLRSLMPTWDFEIDATAGWRLQFDTNTSAFVDIDTARTNARAAELAAMATASGRNVFVMTMGFNDYANSGTNGATTFANRMVALVQAIKALKPSAEFVFQTLLYTPSTQYEKTGGTLADYRAAIDTVIATLGYGTKIDGTTLIDNANDLSDGIHPTTAGHTKMAGRYQTALSAL